MESGVPFLGTTPLYMDSRLTIYTIPANVFETSRNESCGPVIPDEQPTVARVKCIQGSTQIAFLLKLAYTTCVGFCMYVWSAEYALHTARFGTKYSILGDPAVPVHYLIGKKTIQRSDGLTGYVESKQATALRMASITITPRPANTTTSYYRVHHLNCHFQNESLLQTALRRCLQPTNEQFTHRILPAISH